MKKSTLLAVFLLMGVSLNAQVAVYLRPTIITKTNQSRLDGYSVPGFNTIINEHFTFGNRPIFFDDKIDFGIHLGIQIKEKHFIELGYSSDHSSIGNVLLTQSIGTEKQSGEEYQTNETGSRFFSPNYSRFSVDYQYNFWRNKNETIRLQTISGLGLLTIGNDYGYTSSSTNGTSSFDEIARDVYISDHQFTSFSFKRSILYAKLGLGVDFFNRKDRHLFSFEVSYLQSSRIIQFAETKIQVLDDGAETNYRYNQISRGSGIYFTLSRKFQVYPWIPIIKDKI